jgi:hypothetical protein
MKALEGNLTNCNSFAEYHKAKVFFVSLLFQMFVAGSSGFLPYAPVFVTEDGVGLNLNCQCFGPYSFYTDPDPAF